MSVGILKTQWMKKKFGTLLFFVIIINFSAQEKTNDITEVTVKSKFLELPLKRVNENITIISKAEIQNSATWRKWRAGRYFNSRKQF
jgi:hypothetical protein